MVTRTVNSSPAYGDEIMGPRDSQCDTVRAFHMTRDKKRSHNDLDLLVGVEDCKSQRPVTDFSGECLVLLMTCLLSGLGLVNPRIVKGRLFLTCYRISFFLLWDVL